MTVTVLSYRRVRASPLAPAWGRHKVRFAPRGAPRPSREAGDHRRSGPPVSKRDRTAAFVPPLRGVVGGPARLGYFFFLGVGGVRGRAVRVGTRAKNWVCMVVMR
jgi:hypothetical protein